MDSHHQSSASEAAAILLRHTANWLAQSDFHRHLSDNESGALSVELQARNCQFGRSRKSIYCNGFFARIAATTL